MRGRHCQTKKLTMTPTETFKQLLARIDWIKSIIKRKKWDLIIDVKMEEPASENDVLEVENLIGFRLPEDYRTLFTKCAKSFEFYYQMKDFNIPDEFQNIFSGELSWSLDTLPQMYNHYLLWVEASLDPEANDVSVINVTEKIWRQKVPLMNVPNGDIIVVGYNPSEVVYFSHEGGKMHGKRLGNSLFEFLEFHSRIGFIGSEDWQFEVFYDFEKDMMVSNGDKVNSFVEWLNS